MRPRKQILSVTQEILPHRALSEIVIKNFITVWSFESERHVMQTCIKLTASHFRSLLLIQTTLIRAHILQSENEIKHIILDRIFRAGTESHIYVLNIQFRYHY